MPLCSGRASRDRGADYGIVDRANSLFVLSGHLSLGTSGIGVLLALSISLWDDLDREFYAYPPGRQGGCPPRPPQCRTCPIRASGSSLERFVPSGVAVNDPGRRQRVTDEEHIEVAP
jgi:hypothetical protein